MDTSFCKEEYLSLKHPLRFRKDGSFKILMLTDPHGGVGMNPQLYPAVEAVVGKTLPDLVLLGGDMSGCRIGCGNEADMRDYLSKLTAPMESRRIPWAHVYGNHDTDLGLSAPVQQAIYESFTYCISKRGPPEIDGLSNHVLPVFFSDRVEPAFNVWGLDTNKDNGQFLRLYGLPEDTKIVLPKSFGSGYGSNSAHFNQVRWYYETSCAIERSCGRKIPGMLYSHVPLPEYSLIPRNRKQCRMEGVCREKVCSGELNFGLFAACLQRGDVKAIFCGHDHINDFTGVYCGIRLSYCAGINYDAGSHNSLRGGRVIELRESDPWDIKTYMVRVRDILGRAANNKRFWR